MYVYVTKKKVGQTNVFLDRDNRPENKGVDYFID